MTSADTSLRSSRSYGEGSIVEKTLKDGRLRYMVRIRLPGGRRRTVGTYGSLREAVRKLQLAQGEVRAGRLAARNRTRAGDYLNSWLVDKEGEGLAYGTLVSYRAAVKRAILAFGQLRVDAVEPEDITRLLDDTRAKSGRRTAQQTRTILHGAFEYALEDGLLGKNPVIRRRKAMKTLGKAEHTEKPVLDLDQVLDLFARTRGEWLNGLYVVAATTGLRRGELLGLMWKDINLDDLKVEKCAQCGKNKPLRPLTLHVHRQQQRQTGRGFVLTDVTIRSRREVPLIDLAVKALNSQRVLLTDQARKLGTEWHDSGRVFPSIFGTPLDGANLIDRFYKDLDRLGLPRVVFHSLRKTACSIMAAYDVPVAVAQAVMGHEKSSTTLDIYTRLGSTELNVAREKLNAVYAKRLQAGIWGLSGKA